MRLDFKQRPNKGKQFAQVFPQKIDTWISPLKDYKLIAFATQLEASAFLSLPSASPRPGATVFLKNSATDEITEKNGFKSRLHRLLHCP